MRNSSKFRRGMRDCLAVCREFGKSYVVGVNANQPASVQWCLLSKQTIKAFTKSTGWQESALGSSIPLLFKLFTFIVSLMKKLFDQLNLRYDEQYNDSVPLNQTVIVLVSPLFLCVHAVTDYGSSRSKAQRKGVMIRAGKESGKKPSPPLSLFSSSSPVFPPLYHILV